MAAICNAANPSEDKTNEINCGIWVNAQECLSKDTLKILKNWRDHNNFDFFPPHDNNAINMAMGYEASSHHMNNKMNKLFQTGITGFLKTLTGKFTPRMNVIYNVNDHLPPPEL